MLLTAVEGEHHWKMTGCIQTTAQVCLFSGREEPHQSSVGALDRLYGLNGLTFALVIWHVTVPVGQPHVSSAPLYLLLLPAVVLNIFADPHTLYNVR